MNQPLMELMAYYIDQGVPGDQQMLIHLLQEAQEMDGGSLSEDTLQTICETCGVKQSMLCAIIRRVPTLCTSQKPHRLEICQTCKKGAPLHQIAQEMLLGGCYTYRATPCMKNCQNGPSVRWDGVLVPDITPEKLRQLLKTSKKER